MQTMDHRTAPTPAGDGRRPPPSLPELQQQQRQRPLSLGPPLPPIPPEILSLASPKPTRPAGGAVDTATTLTLERAASAALIQQQQQQRSLDIAAAAAANSRDTTAAASSSPAVAAAAAAMYGRTYNSGSTAGHQPVGPSTGSRSSTVNSSAGPPNSRVADWVATSGSQPGFADYANTARGHTPRPAPAQMQGVYGQAQAQAGSQQQGKAYSQAYQPYPLQQAPWQGQSSGSGSYGAPLQATNGSGWQQYPPPPVVVQPPPQQQPNAGNTARMTMPAGSGPPRSSSMDFSRGPQTLHHSMSDLSLHNHSAHPPPSGRVGLHPQQPNNAHPGGHARAQTTSTYESQPRQSAGGYESSLAFPIVEGPSGAGPRSRRGSQAPPVPSAASSPGPPSHSNRQHRQSDSNSGPLPESMNATAAALCIALPTQAELSQQRESANFALNPAHARVSWAKAVLKFVERHQATSASSSNEFGKITDPVLVKWTDEAIRLILSSAEANPPVPEAWYLRGELSNSGKFPSYRAKDSSSAFRDFEAAANAGFIAAWAKIALAYETFGEQNNSIPDFERAKRAYEEGVSKNEVTCTYRIAMAHMLGQLGFQANPSVAVPMLRTAASLSTVDDPLPAYIYGMLLAGELDLGDAPSAVPPALLLNENGQQEDARPWIERSAYLGYAPAQFKMGSNYEYASMGCVYDPLLSVQYYSLASQQGDIEADMALSKWFLCGSEAFDLQESLAFTFAEKAARKGLPSAEFALGYYYELGIGGRKDIELSRRWYAKAAEHGNSDAKDRLAALSGNNFEEHLLSRNEHENQINDRIVRKRTQAKADSERRGGVMSAPVPALPSSVTPFPTASSDAAGRPPPRNSSYGAPAPYVPNVMPTNEGNSTLRRRETMRQVEQAAQYGRRTSNLSQSQGTPAPYMGSPTPAPAHFGGGQATNGVGQAARNQYAPSAGYPTGSPQQRGREPSQSLAVHHSAAGAGLQRYSLVDSGPVASSGAPSAVSSNTSSNSSGVQIVNKPQAAIGPQTFEAMGLKTGKVKADAECIIS